MATRNRETSLAAMEKTPPPAATLSDLQAPKNGTWKRLVGPTRGAVGQKRCQQPNRRRTTPASPSKPVPRRLIVPGSGTTDVDPVSANPVLEQLRPSRRPT